SLDLAYEPGDRFKVERAKPSQVEHGGAQTLSLEDVCRIVRAMDHLAPAEDRHIRSFAVQSGPTGFLERTVKIDGSGLLIEGSCFDQHRRVVVGDASTHHRVGVLGGGCQAYLDAGYVSEECLDALGMLCAGSWGRTLLGTD